MNSSPSRKGAVPPRSGSKVASSSAFRGLNTVMVTGIVYSLAMQMAVLLVPLYAISIGLSPLNLAFLISLPAVLQIVIRALGAVIHNLLGEKRMLKISFLAISCGGVAFIFGETLINLYVAQLMLCLSRALFWSTLQTYLSRLPEAEGRLNRVFGLFESAVAVGGVLGLITAGFVSQWFGFTAAFLCLIAFGIGNFLLSLALPDLPRSQSVQTMATGLKSLLEVARHKPLYLAGICAFTAALPMSLVGSFYPVYLHSLGMQEGAIGVITSLKAVGTLTAGLVIARFLDRINLAWSYTVSMVLVGVTLIMTQLFSTAGPLGAIIIFTGLGAGVSSILFQSLTSKYSSEDNRGPAMAFTTNFWTLSHLVTPVMFGAVTENIGLSFSFIIAGTAILVFGLMGTIAFRWFIPEEYA